MDSAFKLFSLLMLHAVIVICHVYSFRFIFHLYSQNNTIITTAHPILRSNQQHMLISTRKLPILFLEKNVAISKLLPIKRSPAWMLIILEKINLKVSPKYK